MYQQIKTKKDVKLVAKMAHDIWTEHYKSLFHEDHLDAVINAAQSADAIEAKLNSGYLYFFIVANSENAGYLSYKLDFENDELFLCKFYLLNSYRKKGLGRKTMNYLEDICRQKKLNNIALTVYEKNISSIEVYQQMGFENLGIIDRHFGENLVFKDYKMIKKL